MKKLFLYLLFMAFAAVTNAQTSVCGIDFGTSYHEVEKKLEKRFGSSFVDETDDTKICYLNKTYEGIDWEYMMFGFTGVVNDGYLNYCVLAKHFQTSAAAVRFREKLKRKMDVKFGNIEYKGVEDGFKYYLGGVNPFDESQYGFRIAVEKEPDGTYSAGIWYGPYDITPENLGFGD